MNMTDLTNLSTWTPPVTPSYSWSTNKVTFSNDSLLAIIETDNFNPIYIINVNTFSVISSFFIDDLIIEANFLDTSNKYLTVFCQNSFRIVDISKGKQYIMPAISATTLATDWQSNIFTCQNDVLLQRKISVSTEDQFKYQLVLDEQVEEIFTAANSTLLTVSNITSQLYTVASSIPFSLYFLGFLNYFTMCSLYVFLNFPLPEQVYDVLSFVYKQLSEDLSQSLGI